MKKYEIPSMKVINVVEHDMLAGSVPDSGIEITPGSDGEHGDAKSRTNFYEDYQSGSENNW